MVIGSLPADCDFGSLRQRLFNPVHVQTAVCVAVLEAIQHFLRLGDLSGLKVENAESRIASRPFGSISTARSNC